MWVYIVFNYQLKYKLDRNKTCLRLLSILFAINVVISQLYLAYSGWTYIYQSVLSYLYTIIYLRLIIYLDDDIMRAIEQLSFIKKTSRTMKFMMLFLCIVAYIFLQILSSGTEEIWVENQNWMQNNINVSYLFTLVTFL